MNVNYKLSQPIPGVFLLQIQEPHDLAMTFWRAQEFYESSNNLFKGRKFTFAEYAIWYGKVFRAGTEKASMSYAGDWVGFNVPGYILEKAYQVHDERMAYDQLMLQAMAACRFLSGDGRYYLIGTSFEDPHGALDHELAHGMYTVNREYRAEMTGLIAAMPADLRTNTLIALNEMGYNDEVCEDELQANMATGIVRALGNLKSLHGLKALTGPFEECFKRHLPPISTQLLCETSVDLSDF
jgi:hypothetical protein